METVQIDFPPKMAGLFEPHRYKVYYGGRGGVKSWSFARALLIKGLSQPLRVLCAREFQNSIKESVHKLLSDQIELLGFEGFYEIQQTTIKGLNGTEFNFEGLRHNVTKIKSYEGVDIVWVEEAEKVSKTSWDVLIPTIRKPGSEIWIGFNPEFEDDETYERFVLNPPASALVVETNYRDNPWFPDVLEEERIDLKRRDPDAYDHVWEGKCRRWLDGAIYANELRLAYEENRITKVPYDPALSVYTAWDIGHTDDTAIWWFQLVMGEVHLIECYALSGGSPSHFASQILGKEVTIDIIEGQIVAKVGDVIEDIAHRTEYVYERHYLPHDARAKVLAASGKSVQRQLEEAIGPVTIANNMSREDGIAAARTTFAKCWFDKEKCADGLKALRKYHRERQADEVSLRKNPNHDWSSHYADAFRYLSVSWQAFSGDDGSNKPPPDPYGFDEDDGSDWKAA